ATLNRDCGVFLAEKILGTIRTQMDLCAAEMKSEISSLNDELPRRRAALETSCRELADCMGTWFKKGKSQLIEDVCDAVRRLAVLRREIKRREMARQFYNSMDSMLGEFYQRINVILGNLQAASTRASQKIESTRQTIGATSFFQFDMAVDEVTKVTCTPQQVNLNSFIRTTLMQQGGIAALADMTVDETYAAMAVYCSKLPEGEQYERRTVDEVLRSMPAPQRAALLSRAISKSLPLFTYNYRGYDADVRQAPMDAFYVGVADDRTTCLRDGNLFQELVPNGSKVDFSGIGITDRIIIYRQIGVLPAFTLTAIDTYQPEYQRFEADKPHTSHWDTVMCERMAAERFSLYPTDTVDLRNAMGLWVMAVLYGLVDFSDGQYRIKSRGLGGRPLSGYRVAMGATRKEAFDFFCDNLDVLKPEVEARVDELDVPGPENVIRKTIAEARRQAQDGTYLQGLSQCPIPAAEIEFYPAEADLINSELEYILEL
ncbi:MAG: hypothetical protein K2F72_05155, partial [Muribaculaceae bacterium]|nr:hypothetical protein [Muribaculaceae bacterium]